MHHCVSFNASREKPIGGGVEDCVNHLHNSLCSSCKIRVGKGSPGKVDHFLHQSMPIMATDWTGGEVDIFLSNGSFTEGFK